MKIKIILALTVLVTLAVTSADAQSVRERRHYQQQGIHQDLRHGKVSKGDRHRLAREKRHYRKDNFRGHRNDHFSYRDKRHFRHDRMKGGRNGYGYRNNGARRFD
jgi:hypothetical protein